MSNLWDNSQFNTTRSANLVNWVINRKAIAIATKWQGLLYAILGHPQVGKTPMDGLTWDRLEHQTGKKIEAKLRADLEEVEPMAFGAPEVAGRVRAYNNNIFGNAEWDWTMYVHNHDIPKSDMDMIRGDEAKTESYITERLDHVLDSWHNRLGNDINTDQDQGADGYGGWPFAVSASGVYGTIDRDLAVNSNFRGNEVDCSSSDPSLSDLLSARLKAQVNGGNARLVLANEEHYQTLAEEIQNKHNPGIEPKDWVRFGGEYYAYGKQILLLEQRAPSDEVGVLDPDTWCFTLKEGSLSSEGVMRDPGSEHGFVLPFDAYGGLVCKHPGANSKLINCA